MDRDGASEDTKIDLEDTIEQVGVSPLEQYGSFPDNIPGITVKEQAGNQIGADSTHKGMEVVIKDRDPKGVNEFLKVTFKDVIAEPASVHSFDKVWLWSHTLFEVSRLWIYRLMSLLLAVPLALLAGLLFAILSCLHIWLIVPTVQIVLLNMHWVKLVWASVLDLTISPFFFSLGRCCGAISIRWTED